MSKPVYLLTKALAFILFACRLALTQSNNDQLYSRPDIKMHDVTKIDNKVEHIPADIGIDLLSDPFFIYLLSPW